MISENKYRQNKGDQISEEVNLNFSWLSLISINIFTYTKERLRDNYEIMFKCLVTWETLLYPIIEKEERLERLERIKDSIEHLRNDLNNIYSYDDNGNVNRINYGLQRKASKGVDVIFRQLIKLTHEEGILKQIKQDPSKAMSMMGSS